MNVGAAASTLGGDQRNVNGVRVTIDARALSDSTVVVDSSAVEQTSATFSLELLPGTHQIASRDGSKSVSFTVNPDGTISYDASEGDLLSIEGALTLVVRALR
jgi:hypothetical protein